MVLSASQHRQLETIVHSIAADLQVEDATLAADHTLELVLCREFVCFQPLRVRLPEGDMAVALAGQPQAQVALKTYLQSALQGLL